MFPYQFMPYFVHLRNIFVENNIQYFNIFYFVSLGKPYYGGGMEDHISEEAGGYVDGSAIPLGSPARSSPQSLGSEATERFSRKVFVGGLPPDIDEG